MDSYLNIFERYAMAVGWERDMWVTNLSALLSGKALDVFARMPIDDAMKYDELKSALLKRFELTEEGFKKRYRSCRPDKGETYGQFVVRLQSYLQRWVDMSNIQKTYEGLFDLMVRDQLLHICNRELSLFLLERTPQSAAEMAKLADKYREARSVSASSLTFQRNDPNKHKGNTVSSSDRGSIVFSGRDSSSKGSAFQLRTEKRCYKCGKLGHIASNCTSKCPKEKGVAAVDSSDRRSQSPHRVRFTESKGTGRSQSQSSSTPTPICNAFLPVTHSVRDAFSGDVETMVCPSSGNATLVAGMPTANGFVEDQSVTFLRDTGCSGVIVQRSCIKERQISAQSRYVSWLMEQRLRFRWRQFLLVHLILKVLLKFG